MNVALYGHWICPYATRVQFALEQRAIPYELIDLPPSGVRPPDFELPAEFVEHSTRREIPMVRVGDRCLADSIPILEWLETEITAAPLLPTGPAAQQLIRERMAWIDEHAFRPMVGVYYGTDPARIERDSTALGTALGKIGRWAEDTGWIAGPDVSLAEAVVMPLHVRLGGLQQLGFTADVAPSFTDHGDRCRALPGWPGVAWSSEQRDEFVGRFTAFRQKKKH
ncbi:MAG: glutathione S-transferase family protein [Actinomycetota bacterium]